MAPPSAPAVAASSPSLQELYNLLRSVVKPEWSHILDPASDEWKKKFRERVDAETSVTSPPLSSTSSASTNDCAQSFSACSTLSDGSSVCSLPREQQLHLLVKMSSILETPWLVAQKRLEGIKEAEKARPLTLDQVVTYARRLGGSTAAPPETANISDVVTHQSIYPTFHFLPYPSMEELQTSRLGFLASKPFDRVCFPPEIRSQWTVRLRKSERSCDEEGDSRAGTETNVPGYEVRLVCQTPGAQLVYCVFDGLLAPNALPAQPLWKETRYTSEAPVFLSTPFPKTLVARALKPPLQPSRPTLLRLNPRNLATQSPARSLPSGRPRLPAPQAPAQREREEGGDAATAELCIELRALLEFFVSISEKLSETHRQREAERKRRREVSESRGEETGAALPSKEEEKRVRQARKTRARETVVTLLQEELKELRVHRRRPRARLVCSRPRWLQVSKRMQPRPHRPQLASLVKHLFLRVAPSRRTTREWVEAFKV
uniref:Mediator complex subunit MED4 n=1 Tax=Toxoplasma gondii (strain ATCC 50861 / VEG) TaxID=432359 RepID=A0A0F7V7I6_TOXGV|nr:TPA: mediator complex subunit MED4 [Toxoplasma gondii VEG]